MTQIARTTDAFLDDFCRASPVGCEGGQPAGHSLNDLQRCYGVSKLSGALQTCAGQHQQRKGQITTSCSDYHPKSLSATKHHNSLKSAHRTK